MKTPQTSEEFDLALWCDYVRGVAPQRIARSMRRALESSEEDRKTVALFEQVRSVAEKEERARVPSYAVRVAKAVSALERPSSKTPAPRSGVSSVLRFLPVSVTFDSLESVPAGTRDFSSSHRFASFRASAWSVHVRIENETNPRSQVVVGQLLHHCPDPRPVHEIPVLVRSDGHIVGRSLTSRFGEFQADGLPPNPLELCLLVGPDECIELPLKESLQDA